MIKTMINPHIFGKIHFAIDGVLKLGIVLYVDLSNEAKKIILKYYDRYFVMLEL